MPSRPARRAGTRSPNSGVAAAVDAEDLAGDVAGLLGGEEGAGRGDVLRQASFGKSCQTSLLPRWRQMLLNARISPAASRTTITERRAAAISLVK
jgi:hypothetical protein